MVGYFKTKEAQKSLRGFTIVELLIVVVVIAILAAITIVAYNGITNQAKEGSLKSSLTIGARQLHLDKVEGSSFPSSKPVYLGDTIQYSASSDTSYARHGAFNGDRPYHLCTL